MPQGRIYHQFEDRLVELRESSWDAEDVLQSLLARYPDLLAGDQMRPSAPRRWLLVEREAGIEDAAGGLARWSLDHLFLDQDAIPTLVEVKRRSDTRIRREVVVQLLDYAANAVAHWPPGELRERFEERCEVDGSDPTLAVEQLIARPGTDAVEAFWAAADANLGARRLRLVFLADEIPPELARIIEFLNESFARTEVFGVEVRQFVGEDHKTLVPRVLGRTATAEQVKETGSSSMRSYRWTAGTLLEAAESLGGSHAQRLVQAVLDWSQSRGVIPTIGAGKGGPVYVEIVAPDRTLVKVASVNATGAVLWGFNALALVRPFDDLGIRLECLRRLNALPGVAIADHYAINATWPQIPTQALNSDEAVAELLSIVEWAAELISEAADE